MRSLYLLLFSGLTGVAAVAADNAESVPIAEKEVCMEGPLAQFGRYVGDWIIQDWRLDQNGVDWIEGDGARWNFICLGDGTAVQDFWIPNGGSIGTNLRTYNSETNSWDIAWAITPAPGLSRIEAKQQEDGSIVMHYKTPQPDRARRITFFPPNEDGWKWKLEISTDQGVSWVEVYRIAAHRIK